MNNSRSAFLSLITRSTNAQMLLAMLSGLFIALPFVSASFFYTTWFAFIPVLLAIQQASLTKTYGLGLICGTATYMVGAYWIVDFLMLFKHYSPVKSFIWSLIFWFYSAQLPALLLVTFQYLKRATVISELILFPIIVVCFFACFPMLFSAQLGESQALFLTALQATDITGVYGLDAIIALFNLVLVQLLLKQANIMGVGLSGGIIVSWFAYGMVTLNYWNQELKTWPSTLVGIVQPNETPSLEKPKIYPGYSRAYSPEMDMTERLAQAGAELVVWPEARYKAFFDEPHVKRAYQSRIKQLGITLIFQDMEQFRHPETKKVSTRFNAAAIIDSSGNQTGHYQKRKRVAFGEYIPLITDLPFLRFWVKDFFGNFTNEITKGTTPTHFSADNFSITPLVCYEVMFPTFVAQAIPHRNQQGLLVAMSSNGWFGETKQPYQHIYSATLRAVENRMPMIHAVNNGPSTATLPTGEIILLTEFHQAGGYLVDLPYSTQHLNSFFQQHPRWFIGACIIALLAMCFVSVLPHSRLKGKYSAAED